MQKNKKKRLTVAELEKQVEELKKEVDELKKQPREVVHIHEDLGPRIIKYGLPGAERSHLLVFANGQGQILPDEAAVNAWINDPMNEQPTAIWAMKKRTVV
jgi:hypothetical protein